MLAHGYHVCRSLSRPGLFIRPCPGPGPGRPDPIDQVNIFAPTCSSPTDYPNLTCHPPDPYTSYNTPYHAIPWNPEREIYNRITPTRILQKKAANKTSLDWDLFFFFFSNLVSLVWPSQPNQVSPIKTSLGKSQFNFLPLSPRRVSPSIFV